MGVAAPEAGYRVDTSAFNVLSLCSGVGGLELGLKLAVPSARTICFVEREAYCCEILAERMEDGYLDEAPVWTDIATFDGVPWRGVVDCVTGGYPCQPFSVIGKRRGDEDERHLWPEVARVVREVGPRWCFFENVGNHLRVGFEQVHDELSQMGYVVAAGLFTAEEVGAAHKRERLFVLAHSGDHGRGNPAFETVYQGWRSAAVRPQDVPGREGRLPDQPDPEPRPSGFALACPPRPDDWDGWDRVLSVCPAIEPVVRGGADGLACRLDRLRACGNGVVPMVAAYAWGTLAASLRGVSS